MSMSELKLLFPTEKLDALRFFMDRKQMNIDQELKDYLDKAYEKVVPAHVREYVESRLDPDQTRQQALAPEAEQASEPETEQTPAARERPARQTRRQREQTSAELSSAPDTQTEAEGPAEEETQGMAMSM